MSIEDVTARIASIQAQFGGMSASTATAAPAAAPGNASGAAFAAALTQAGGAGATGFTGATGATGGLPTTTGGVDGSTVIAEARKYLGVPYVWGGTDPAKGLDCSGLVQLVYRNLGHELPRVSYQQATAGEAVPSMAQAQPGDVLAFGSPVHHVGIYIGDGQMIEAPRPGTDVRISTVSEAPTAIRRILPQTAAPFGALAGVLPSAAPLPAGTPYADLFTTAAANHGVPANLLAAVARHESGFDAGAVSPAGAQGLMQLMPGTARGLGVQNSFDPAQAVDGAARMLSTLMDRFGRTDLALAAYNAGPGAVMRYDGIPPYPETTTYVNRVLDTMRSGR